MSDQLISAVVTVLTALTGVAIIAVLVSNKAQTGSVISAGGNAFSQALEDAVSPVTGIVAQVSTSGSALGFGGANFPSIM